MQRSRCVVQGWQHDFACIINLPHFQWNPGLGMLIPPCVEKGARQNSAKPLMKVSPVSIRKVKFACTYAKAKFSSLSPNILSELAKKPFE